MSIHLNKYLVLCNGDIYQSNYGDMETTSITGTIFNLNSSQLNDCAVLVDWKHRTYPLSNGTYVLHNMVPGEYIITISHPELMFHDVFIIITKIQGAFRVLASRYSPYYGREGKSWDKIAHQPIGLYSEISSESFMLNFKMSMPNILGLVLVLLVIYSIVYTPTILTKRKLFAMLYDIEWLSKKTGHGWIQISELTKQYINKDLNKSDFTHEKLKEIDWGTINNVETYSDDMASPFMSKILHVAQSLRP
ncbi:hypothetical protein BMR1_02g01645 [Babesia microti strain RI]|uniref:ER membrane protein complex subunit 7 beta-sandwich domain-containing protein n=1 Tax=Babesia microti (strain RI) TaxID=1133968 RepID=I7J9X0_BABMR|nr:hypothetical protein BMR1_02g01645 [Babesia microti strain RI]CCF73489.1 hypothetical protein BMR1_02g01645 [Babesia microti strain RI]|eukprot:XP_012648098.1 hypothetical protein BMR1_02g01645 [Babesia microti strain RI]